MWERRRNTQPRNATSVGSTAPGLPCAAGEQHVTYGTKTGNEVGTDPAQVCDRQLVTLLATERALDKHVAIGLARVWDEQKYRALGHARGVDYALERLGMKPGRARWLVKVGRAIAEHAELNQALTTGRLSASQVVELAPALSACSEAERAAGVEQAASLAVRALRALVRGEPNGTTANLSEEAAAGGSIDGRSDPSPDIDPGVWFSLRGPARVGELWPLATNLVRKVAGRHLPLYCCAELISAEYLSFATDTLRERTGCDKCGGIGDLLTAPSAEQAGTRSNTLESPGEESPAEPSSESPGTWSEKSSGGSSQSGASLSRESLSGESRDGASENGSSAANGSLDADTSGETGASTHARLLATLSGRTNSPMQPAGSSSASPGHQRPGAQPDPETADDFSSIKNADDARSIHAALERLQDRQRRLRLEIGEQIHILQNCKGWRGLSFNTLRDYCESRLNISKRLALDLIRFYRRLRSFKRLRRAYLGGAIHYSKVRSLLKVVRPATERPWLEWARRRSCREVEAITQYTELYVLPPSDAPTFAPRTAASDERKTSESSSVPQPGAPLPPLSNRSGPRIAGKEELIMNHPEKLSTHIRFWAPTAEAQVFKRALARCRELNGPCNDGDDADWRYVQIILTHFILTHDAPGTRRPTLRYKIFTRDDFICGIPTCTSRANFEAHHIWMRSEGGPDDAWNLLTLCASHHHMVHEGIVEIGGWAPWAVIIRQGIDPRNNRAADSFRNGLRTSDAEARKWMAHWRRWCRTRGKRTHRFSGAAANGVAATSEAE